MSTNKTPAVFKGLSKEETVALAVDREKDIKKKATFKMSSLVESHKAQKTAVAATAVVGGAMLEAAAHASETAQKYDPVIGAVVGGAGVALATFAEDETAASFGLGLGAAGFGRTANWMARKGAEKFKEMRAAKASSAPRKG